MNTPSHMLIGAAFFARRDRPRTTLAAFAGGLAPDLSLFLMVGWAVFFAGASWHDVFGELYSSDAWQRVFAVDHSLPLWTALALVARLAAAPALLAFAGSGLAHAATDLLLHHDDARRQLWPLSDWVFRSPVSYWDPRHHGDVVAPLEALLVLALTAALLRRLARRWERALVLVVAGVLLVPILATGGFHGLHGTG